MSTNTQDTKWEALSLTDVLIRNIKFNVAKTKNNHSRRDTTYTTATTAESLRATYSQLYLDRTKLVEVMLVKLLSVGIKTLQKPQDMAHLLD